MLGVLPREHQVADAHVEELLRQREAARRAQDYATADRLRQELEASGVLVEDTPEGPRWRMK